MKQFLSLLPLIAEKQFPAVNLDDPDSEDEDDVMNRDHEEFLEVQLMAEEISSSDEASDDEIAVRDEQQLWVDRQLMTATLRHESQQQVNVGSLPSTCKVFHCSDSGGVAYVVGTAHFSQKSCEDVRKVISLVQPDSVLVELCTGRASILKLDDEAYLNDIEKTTRWERYQRVMAEKKGLSGAIRFLMQESSHHITKQLKMAPGSEMRTAFKETNLVPGCAFHLGDRPIETTMKRMFNALTFKDKLVLIMKSCQDLFATVTPEEIEELKKVDIFEKLMEELSRELPKLATVVVEERDFYLSAYLKHVVSKRVEMPGCRDGRPRVAVSVVGMGHVGGMEKIFNSLKDPLQTLKELDKLPEKKATNKVLKIVIKSSLCGVAFYTIFRVLSWTSLFDKYPSINWI